MGNLSALRIVRMARTKSNVVEHPQLEALVDSEFAKVSEGYHLARWIVPLIGATIGGVFLPLALRNDPLFIFLASAPTLVGVVLGIIFHLLARRISPTQLELRKRCSLLGQRMVGWANLAGVTPAVSPKVGDLLEEAAGVYLSVKPEIDRAGTTPAKGVWAEASLKAQTAMVEAMTKMLTLAEPVSLQAQEAELARGWAQPLLEEMKATAALLLHPSPRAQIAAEIEASSSPLAGLVEARAQLERLETASAELESEELRDRV